MKPLLIDGGPIEHTCDNISLPDKASRPIGDEYRFFVPNYKSEDLADKALHVYLESSTRGPIFFREPPMVFEEGIDGVSVIVSYPNSGNSLDKLLPELGITEPIADDEVFNIKLLIQEKYKENINTEILASNIVKGITVKGSWSGNFEHTLDITDDVGSGFIDSIKLYCVNDESRMPLSTATCVVEDYKGRKMLSINIPSSGHDIRRLFPHTVSNNNHLCEADFLVVISVNDFNVVKDFETNISTIERK